MVQAIGKSDADADTAFKMVKAVQKRALSDEEPKTLGVRVCSSPVASIRSDTDRCLARSTESRAPSMTSARFSLLVS